MQAAVYKGSGVVEVESIPVPQIGPGEILIRVETCGIFPTDLKKIAYNLLPPPRIYGHETAGVVAAVGSGVTRYSPGDRVIVFHHIPCGKCFYCARKLYAQCPVYKKVGVTAGYEPAGGGFSQYVRAMDWIVERGIERIPDGVSFDQACFVEPVNTCLKGVKQVDPQPEDVVVILGQKSESAPSPRTVEPISSSSPPPPPAWSSKPSPAHAPAPAFCCSRRPRIRSASKFPEPPFAWKSALCAAPTAPPSISSANRPSWCSAAPSPWRS
jgi:hypothetical protein